LTPFFTFMLRRGFILLPEGKHGNVIGFTPPLTITKTQLRETVRELEIAMGSVQSAKTH
jgi:4-aminobutyrate aminotransferase-like enzyme